MQKNLIAGKMDLNFAGGVRFSRALNIDTKIAYQHTYIYTIHLYVRVRLSVYGWQILSALKSRGKEIETSNDIN